jgi:PBSX family phage terminase large subunit
MTSNIKLSELIPPHFHELHKHIKNHDYTEYTLPGGRGSCKSSFIGEEIPLLIKRNPKMHALVLRKVGNTLKDSVYNQILWAIDMLGLSNEFKATSSPMQIVYKPTGQTIYFRGLDDPLKTKSIKPKFGYIGILWFEELDQFGGNAEIRSVEQSVKRGGDKFYVFKSFNPPISASNWANGYILENKPDRIVVKSDYRSVPPEWLGTAFYDDAEYLRKSNPKAYEHEYLGVPTGNGGNVFENVTIRKITDDEIKQQFDRIYMGVDWGWYPDVFAWTKMHFDTARRTLYIFDEYRCNKQSNKQTADTLIKEKKVTYSDLIIADSAEPKSIGDYKDYGLYCKPVSKPPGSVEYSMKWLQSLNAIIIDNERCPGTAKEFIEYEYERSKDGEVISGYPDANNHSIDSVRYAMYPVWKRKGQ